MDNLPPAVSVISGKNNTVIRNIPCCAADGSPWGIAFDPANGNLYVINTQDFSVLVISGKNNTVIGSPIMYVDNTLIVATLFGIVPTAFVSSWLTPAIIGWRKTKRQRKFFRECENQIGKLDKDAIEEEIIGYYVDGKISQEHRQFLNDKIAEYYKKENDSERYAPFT